MQTGQQMSSAARQSSNARVQALAGATTALATRNAMYAVRADPDSLGGVNLSGTAGTSRQHSTTITDSDTASGSTVRAGGTVRISATGDGKASSITIQGRRRHCPAGGTKHRDDATRQRWQWLRCRGCHADRFRGRQCRPDRPRQHLHPRACQQHADAVMSGLNGWCVMLLI
ncbi:MAG TPA: hypothetical protein ACQGQI_07815 [Xylella sp.]